VDSGVAFTVSLQGEDGPGNPAGAVHPRHLLGCGSLHTEATHYVFWNMSTRGMPRSFRTMEGFGVHTFRLVNAP
jgi:hypothetical protein